MNGNGNDPTTLVGSLTGIEQHHSNIHLEVFPSY